MIACVLLIDCKKNGCDVTRRFLKRSSKWAEPVVAILAARHARIIESGREVGGAGC